MRSYDTAASRRQREIMLSPSPSEPTPRSEIPMLTPQLAAAYAQETSKPVNGDMNRLITLGFIERTPRGLRPMIEMMEAFIASTSTSGS